MSPIAGAGSRRGRAGRRVARAHLAAARVRGLEPSSLLQRRLSGRITALESAEPNLCFGRIDRADGVSLHIGRTGINDDGERIVVDWRAPAAEPFYAATALAPRGIVRRRSIAVADRRVVRIDDDLLDPSRASDDLVGEGALLQTLAASRSGRMRDAVATLQTEQDAIIRSPLDGVLVVQGAPGTGKTVVALHRAAYLLYRSPQLLSRGVLVIGPNARFLDYISDVLPALGETNVVTSTMDDLYPGHHGLPAADPDVARLLGDARMARTLASFIEGLQGAGGPDGHAVTWDGEALHIPRAVIDRCTEAARKTREKHNVARTTFQDTLLDELTSLALRAESDRLAWIEEGLDEEIGLIDSWLEANADSLAPRRPDEELAEAERLTHRQLRSELEHDPVVRHEIDALWPHLTPEEAVRLLLREGLITGAARHLNDHDAERLSATTDAPWTAAHIPLFDEAAEILGGDSLSDGSEADTEAAHQRQRDLAFARQILRTNPALASWMTAEALAERHAVRDHRDLAERAQADRTWSYGHIVVDEAQEFTPMQWRMLVRRCPTKSMTIVGDLAQSSIRSERTTWAERLSELRTAPHVAELTICYRSPRELVDAVEPLLHRLRPDAHPVNAIRSSGRRPDLVDGDIDGIEECARWARRAGGEGQYAIVTPDPKHMIGALADRGVTASDDDLRSPIVVLPPIEVTGLEFDHVLVHSPNEIAHAHGLPTLYVCLTRSTGTLAVVQEGPTLDDLGPAWDRTTASRPSP